MPYSEVEWDIIARDKIGQSLSDLNKRRRDLQRKEVFTQEEANRLLIATIRRVLLDITAKTEWKDIDAIIMGRWLFTKTAVTMYDNPLDANAAKETHNVIRITRF